MLSEIVPDEIPFEIINQVMDKKALSVLIDAAYRVCGNKATVILADRLRTMGFEYATKAGVSICTVEDMERLYAGFDLCCPTTSVSMTISLS